MEQAAGATDVTGSVVVTDPLTQQQQTIHTVTADNHYQAGTKLADKPMPAGDDVLPL